MAEEPKTELAIVQRSADISHTPMLAEHCAALGAPPSPRRGSAQVVRLLAGCFILGAGTVGAAWGSIRAAM
eukprot:396036-Prymnesium_polylepis.1